MISKHIFKSIAISVVIIALCVAPASADYPPAIDLDTFGAVAWSGGNSIGSISYTDLEVWVEIIDLDEISNGGTSHSVKVILPAGMGGGEVQLSYRYHKNPTLAFYEGYRSGITVLDGTYTIAVTDLVDNVTTTKEDVVDVNPPSPPVAYAPIDNVVVSDTSPVFNFYDSPTASFYRVRVYDMDGRTMYKGHPNNPPYTLPPGILAPNTGYKYRIEAREGHRSLDIDNNTRYPASNADYPEFITGPERTRPHIDIGVAGVRTWTDDLWGTYLIFQIEVHDAQGVPQNIKSVKVRLPDNSETPLYMDYFISPTCGVYQALSLADIPQNPADYTFIAEDWQGNRDEYTETLTPGPIDIPPLTSLSPADYSVLNSTEVDFSWGAVDDAAFYRVSIYDHDYEHVRTFITEQNTYQVPEGILRNNRLYRYKIRSNKEFYEGNVSNGSTQPNTSRKFSTFMTHALSGGTSTPVLDTNFVGAVLKKTIDPPSQNIVYYLTFKVPVTDGDGVPDNIDSVTASGPGLSSDLVLKYDEEIDSTQAFYYEEVLLGTDYEGVAGQYEFNAVDHGARTAATVYDDLIVNPLDPIEVVSPLAESKVAGTTPSIQWHEVTGASRYAVDIYNGWTTKLFTSPYITATSYIVPEGVLLLFHDYSYKVVACREPDGVDLDNMVLNEKRGRALPHFTVLPGISGDVDWDLHVGLNDAVVALKTTAGLEVDETNMAADVDGDQKIGLAEAAFALQAEAQVRDMGYNNTHLSGTWMMLSASMLADGYLIFNGAGVIEEFGGGFNMQSPPGTYSVNPDGTFTLTIFDTGNNSFLLNGLLLSDVIASVIVDNEQGHLYKLNNLSVCQGSWSGQLTEYGSSTTYNIAFTVDAQGHLTHQSGDLPAPFTGRMLSWNGLVSAFFKTGYTAAKNTYNQIQLKGNLTDNTVGGIYRVDNGPEDDGSFVLNRQ